MEAFGKYDLLKRIGAGAVREPVLARTRDSAELVVVKRTLPLPIDPPRLLRQLLDEKGIVVRLVDRNIARIFELGETDCRLGDVKLFELSVAKAANKAIYTASGNPKGKFPYIAPEQANGKNVGPRTDVFALGIVMWKLLTVTHLCRRERVFRPTGMPSPGRSAEHFRAALRPDMRRSPRTLRSET